MSRPKGSTNNARPLTDTLVKSLKPREKAYEVRDTKLGGFLLRVQPSGSMSYYCQYAPGQRVQIGKANILKAMEARKMAQQVLADFSKGIDPKADKKKEKAHTLKSYLAEVYAPWLEVNHADGEGDFKRLQTNFKEFGKTKLSDLTPWQITKWRTKRQKDGRSIATTNRDLNMLKAALVRAVEWGFLAECPLTSVKQQRVDSRPKVRFLSEVEEQRLRAALDNRAARISADRATANQWRLERGYDLLPEIAGDHLKPMVILSLNTGLRRGELFNLTWNDLDLDNAMLTVQGVGSKTGETRHISLNSEAVAVLATWKQQSPGELVFTSPKGGGRFTNVNNSWRQLLREAQITDFRWHDMRHTFASNLVMGGTHLSIVQALLGHTDPKMTSRYSHLEPQVKAEAVESLVRGATKYELHELNELA